MGFRSNMLGPFKEYISRAHFVIKDFNDLIDVTVILLKQKRSKPKYVFHFELGPQLIENVDDCLVDILLF